ncbi:MAG: acetyl-CoA decarbonylase/synthase complex subunit gamma [Eggerthellaceae bacterium]|nr:acetyl-CoA decarbonylase/synthase complex subunit gamma [Eggerthellaceae bacterium]
MALKGLDIFKLTPKTNCKDCGIPTCMAFAMKVAQGAIELSKCPHMSEEALATLSEATAPPMKTIKFGVGDAEHAMGGETVLYRHEKTFVSHNLFAVAVTPANFDEKWAEIQKVDYERIGERMYVEALYLVYEGDAAAYAELAQKAKETGRALVLSCADAAAAREALAVCADAKPIVDGATAATVDEFAALASEFGVVVGVAGATIEDIYDAAAAFEAKGYKNLVLDVGAVSIKDAFANAVKIRRGALKDQDRTLGYPSIVNVAALAPGDMHMQCALASLFTCKYGSIVVMEGMTYAESLPLHGLRQNIYTDPQKPMRVEPGVYALNGADDNAVCCTTVDFALTYFVVSGELERSGVPINMIITDAGGYSVLTAWAAGKLSANSISKYIEENGIGERMTNKVLILPGKVAVLKGELEAKLPEWQILVGPNEATDLVKFMKQFQ